jgi:hypothetical protein
MLEPGGKYQALPEKHRNGHVRTHSCILDLAQQTHVEEDCTSFGVGSRTAADWLSTLLEAPLSLCASCASAGCVARDACQSSSPGVSRRPSGALAPVQQRTRGDPGHQERTRLESSGSAIVGALRWPEGICGASQSNSL